MEIAAANVLNKKIIFFPLFFQKIVAELAPITLTFKVCIKIVPQLNFKRAKLLALLPVRPNLR